jgi:acyl transferase domain-containing protein/acyl-CoA synthetase (AMP-forming)/AMP-acid ligase II/surfactin synthase thioesterase subunit/acyl carrier protein
MPEGSEIAAMTGAAEAARFANLGDLVLQPPRGREEEAAFTFLDRRGELERSVSRRELRELSTRAAGSLQQVIRPGAVVVLAGLEGLAFMEAFFGCILAGAVPAPVQKPRHPRDRSGVQRVRNVAAQTSAALVVCEESTLALLRGACVGAAGFLRTLLTPESLRSAGDRLQPVALDPNAIAYLQYTSGSTAEPRGIALTHRNVLANLAFMHRAFGFEEPPRGAAWLPLHHDMGLAGHVLCPLYEGGFSALMSPTTFLRDPAFWLRAIQRFGATTCAAPPFAFDLCVRRRVQEDETLDLSTWNCAIVGSETVSPAVLDRFAEAFAKRGFQRSAFRPSYGLAEATLLAAGGTSHWSAKPLRSLHSRNARPAIGYPCDSAFIEVRVVAPETREAQPAGEAGEIWIAGASVSAASQTARGLEATQVTLPGSDKTWAPTGDWGMLEDDTLFVLGRTKDLVIIRGAKCTAEELEQTIQQCHPDLAPGDSTACFAVEKDDTESFMVVQEVRRGLAAPALEAIRTQIVGALVDAHDAMPARVHFVPAGTLPRTANGKVSRAECRARFTGMADAESEPGPRDDDDIVVIVGMACRFPGADDTEAFWRLLCDGVDAISEVPAERWDNALFYDPRPAIPGKVNTKWGGFLSGIDQFDAAFFGISAKEAAELDPQQRLLLETTWRLFENAGLKMEAFEKTDTGVFVGISTNDYLYTKIKQTPGMETFGAYSGLGNANSIAANRLSYLFDLHGPSLAVDTACSSSLTAFHLAVESVRRGECAMAIAGGANAILSAGPSITFSQFGMLAPDGRCKTFDARADGYVRSEGCGLVLLKRRSDALRDGNRILATVRATAIGQDGRSSGITAPNGEAQRALLRKTLRISGVEAAQVAYVEAHGTGTATGDPIEVAQIKAVYGAGLPEAPCYLGSVKASIGHLEAAAGIASLIKAVLVLQHGEAPPQLHVESLNRKIDLHGSRLSIPLARTPLTASAAARCAAVSSFGFGGANAHVILEAAGPAPEAPAKPAEGACTFTLSARSREALRHSAGDWLRWLRARPDVPLSVICAEHAATRMVFPIQESWRVESREELVAHLEALELPAKAAEQQVLPTANGWLNLPGHPFLRQRHWMEHGTTHEVSREAAHAPEMQDAQSWLYEVEWVARPFQRAPRVDTEAHWVIVGEGRGFGSMLEATLRAEKQTTFRHVDGANYEAFLRRTLTLEARAGADHWKVLYLAALDCAETAAATTASIERDQDLHGPGDVLRLTRAIIGTGRILELWIVTDRAQCVQAADAASLSVAQAPLWGLGKTLFLEHPELRGGLVDLDTADGEAAAQQVIQQASAPEGEHAVAFRSGTRYIAQLAPLATPARAPMQLRATGAYIVTGGLGGLGLRSARWLAEQGARDILLLGRKGLPAREAGERVRAIEALGATVEARAIDIRDSARLASLFTELRQAGRPPRGIVHAAGVNWSGKIRTLDVAEFLDTIKLKVSAAWQLHELTREDDLDCFILFSSVSALWGSVDLSHYTAANHFLDALASYRAGLKLPALALDWGPWAEVGMSSKATESALLQKLGLRLMPPDRAIEAMEQVAGAGRYGAVLADVDWQKFRAFVDFSLSPSLFERVVTHSAVAVAQSSGNHAELRAADDPLSAIEAIVRKALGSVMVLDSETPLDLDQSFNLIGMDSLMAIAFAAELERTLGLTLPVTVAYNYPTIRTVRDYVYELLLAEERVKQLPEEAPRKIESASGAQQWLLYAPLRVATPPRRLYCFPGAGAGASSYASWVEAAASWAEVVRVQLPGREELASLPPLRSLKELAIALADRMPDAAAPFAFHGYSLGALVAFELCRELRRRGRALPEHLFLSGCGVPRALENRSLHTLPDEPFLDALTENFGEQSLSTDRREIARALLSILRADIEMLESFEAGDEAPLSCPITVCVGEQDPLTPRESAMRWHTMTTGDFALRRFAGGHHFAQMQAQLLLAAIRELWQPEHPR